MKLSEKLISGSGKIFSFEFFPPKSRENYETLGNTMSRLKKLNPDFVSVTNSSSGIAPYSTVALSKFVKEELKIETVAHLTCVAHTKKEIRQILGILEDCGIENILALRGDLRKDEGWFKKEYSYAWQLVEEIKRARNFFVGVAAYPEKHPESPDFSADLDNLERKRDAGADFAVTQLFFDNGRYYEFIDKCAKRSLFMPVLPGIMPVTNYKQVEKFTGALNVSMPGELLKGLEKHRNDRDSMMKFSVEYAVGQCLDLLENGARGIHFYTLNRSMATMKILTEIRKRATLSGTRRPREAKRGKKV